MNEQDDLPMHAQLDELLEEIARWDAEAVVYAELGQFDDFRFALSQVQVRTKTLYAACVAVISVRTQVILPIVRTEMVRPDPLSSEAS